MKRISNAALAMLLIAVYWASALTYLDRAPTVHEDEPWIASTSWALATRGIFGSTLFAGMDGMETHYYEFMPLYPLTQAVLFRFAGIGLFQARFVSVAAGALTLSLTYALGRRLFGGTVGVVALSLLVFTRSLASIPALPTGILFFDVNRLARYDAFVPVFGLAALNLFLTARARESVVLFGAAGFVSGMAGLAHLYGAFWGIALGALALWERVHPRARLALTIGFLAPWLVYGLYVWSDLEAWRAQLHWSHGRFELLNPSWYLNNVSSEGLRYDFIGMRLPTRVGAWFSALGMVSVGLILTWRAWFQRDSKAR
ncbi:MAG TPA: glycosyltransferase family 39 protein, partial [Anaerolineae bacterium]|nr:glycosyltransferase family 39 protein [Anaerolineae bacterium]